MSNPLSPTVHRHTDVQFYLAHFKRCRVLMSHQVAYQATVFLDFLCTPAVGNTGGLNDRLIGTHVVHDADESIVKDLERGP